MLRELIERWRARRRREREIAEELQFHLDLLAEEGGRAGLTMAAARRDAHHRFGDVRGILRACSRISGKQPQRSGPPTVAADRFLNVPLSAMLLVGVLLPIGLCSWLVPHRFRTLPYEQPGQLLVSGTILPYDRIEQQDIPYAFSDLRQQHSLFTGLAAFRRGTIVVRPSGRRSGSVVGMAVSPNFFELLGARPLFGEFFSERESGRSAEPIVVSHEYWRDSLEGDPQVIGRRLTIRGREHEIIGVMPAEFWFLSTMTQCWIPLQAGEQARPVRFTGRLRPGVTSEMAKADPYQGWWFRVFGLRTLQPWVRRDVTWALALIIVVLGVSLALGLVQITRLVRAVAPSRVSPVVLAKYYGLLLVKSFVVLLPPAAIWLVLREPAIASGLNLHPLLRDVLPTLTFLVLCYAVIWWSLLDQRLRCYVCLRRLRMPLPLGRLGSILFDLPGTEYICTRGHGTLYVPEPESSELELKKWKPHREMWDELTSPVPSKRDSL